MAAWDQSAYKQTVIRGYSQRLTPWRRLINLAGPILRTPYLPPVDTALNLVYLSHLAVDQDDPEVFAALLRYACSPRDRGLGQVKRSNFVLGLSSRHPLLGAIPGRFRRHTYRTQLYVVDWEEGASSRLALDDRPAQPEVALL
jgi:hypothetical protein